MGKGRPSASEDELVALLPTPDPDMVALLLRPSLAYAPPLLVSTLPAGGDTMQASRGPQSHILHPCQVKRYDRVSASLVPMFGLSPSAHRPFRQPFTSRSIPLHLRVAPNQPLYCRLWRIQPYPVVFVPIRCLRADGEIVRKAHNQRMAFCARARVVVCSFLSPAYANAWRRLPCFFDCRTLPARRGASKRSRLDDHGPQRDPRDRRSGRYAF